jgi:hypothetical protein
MIVAVSHKMVIITVPTELIAVIVRHPIIAVLHEMMTVPVSGDIAVVVPRMLRRRVPFGESIQVMCRQGIPSHHHCRVHFVPMFSARQPLFPIDGESSVTVEFRRSFQAAGMLRHSGVVVMLWTGSLFC